MVSLTRDCTCGTFWPTGAGAAVVLVVGAAVTEGVPTLSELFVVVVPAGVPGAAVVAGAPGAPPTSRGGRIACSQDGVQDVDACSIKVGQSNAVAAACGDSCNIQIVRALAV